MPKPRLLIVDDNQDMADTVAKYMSRHGFDADTAATGSAALARLTNEPADVILTDLRMEGMDGLDLLDAIRRAGIDAPVVIMTAFGAIDSAVEAMQRGAYHYVTKPFRMEVVRVLLERAVTERALRVENEHLRRSVRERFSAANLLGRSTAMRQLVSSMERAASVSSPVLISGETGSGKELVARALHLEGPRGKEAFVAVNCSALPEALLESELFGHTRGAFTGATDNRRGLFVEADGGTLFLDEIGDMPLPLQAKLLRVIETGEVRAVGSDRTKKTDVRLISASHRDLQARCGEGQFREDLFFRLNVIPLRVPPLRERRDDVPLLVAHFLKKCLQRTPDSPVVALSDTALKILTEYAWPGNVRELENLIERVVVMSRASTIEAADVQPALAANGQLGPFDRARDEMPSLRELEQQYIAWVMERVGGNKTRAAEILGIDPSTIYRREKQSGSR